MINHPNRSKKTAKDGVAALAISAAHDHEHDYSELLRAISGSFAAATDGSNTRLFTTNAQNLNDLYLDSLPSERQMHNCRCCRRFIEVYGGLVAIDEHGKTTPVLWNPGDVPEFYRGAFQELHHRVSNARVTGVFLTGDATWGTPVTGPWLHMHVRPHPILLYKGAALSSFQAMAALKENFRVVTTALVDFKISMLDEALRLLKAATLARSEKFVGPVQWLRDLQDRPRGREGVNTLWRAIADAPEGYCHPRSSVIGPLLEDIAAGLPFEDIKRKFDAKLHPLAYQRPQAAPTTGAIRAAEALVEKLGIARSLERRFARVDEQACIWAPLPIDNPLVSGGVFGHVKAKSKRLVKSVELPVQTMTWEKFARKVLPSAERLGMLVPYRANFEARVTALHADAPNILKWSDNTVSSYVYHQESVASRWGLSSGWARVLALSPRPNLWAGDKQKYLGDYLLFILEGCLDQHTNQGNALFPEILRDDLHAVRSVIESYSRTAVIAREEGPHACGITIGPRSARCSLKVFSQGAWSPYIIDRWD